jgi:hypothetical protein
MIKTVASLLAAFSEAEVREIEKAGIKHAPTIGSMYEGLTSTLLHKAIPEGLGLQVVSGSSTVKAISQIRLTVCLLKAQGFLFHLLDYSSGILRMLSPFWR